MNVAVHIGRVAAQPETPTQAVANRNAQKSSVWLGMTKIFSQHGCLASLELFLSR